MRVGRSSSGSESTCCTTSLAWVCLGFKGQDFDILQSEHEASLLHRLREEDPLEDQLDSSYDRSHQGLGKRRVDCVIMANQLVVTQLIRNPNPGDQ